jgi:hypothetical protein
VKCTEALSCRILTFIQKLTVLISGTFAFTVLPVTVALHSKGHNDGTEFLCLYL